MRRIAIVPIDNRPICYSLLEQICAIDKDINLLMPRRDFLGGLVDGANINELLAWLDGLKEVDTLILSLDTIAYGGLVNSRRSPDTYDEIANRLNSLKKVISKKAKKILAHSSIMRISNNNVNEEEKDYWDTWGTRIFEYSYHLHKSELLMCQNCVTNTVPNDILKDYISTRERNFNINKLYLDWLKEGVLDFLVYSKDDSAEYGLNVKEAKTLEGFIQERNLNGLVKTGADEIPLALLSHSLSEGKKVAISPIFLENAKSSLNSVSKYEDISVLKCALGQLELAGVDMSEHQDAQMLMVLNNFQSKQGDLVLGDRINFIRADVLKKFEKTLKNIDKPYFLADVNNANGADNIFTEYFLKLKLNKDFLGYAAYNTSANTIGCAICAALVKFLAKDYDDIAFKKLQFIRLMDDWAYQANIRKPVREAAPDFAKELNAQKDNLLAFESKVNAFLNTDFKGVRYTLPWDRSFEIEIET